MEVAAGRVQAPLAQQELNAPQIDPSFEHMRREAVSQHMGVTAFGRCAACPASRQMVYTVRVTRGRVRGCPERARGAVYTVANTAVTTAGASGTA